MPGSVPRGSLTPLVTPFHDGEIDEAAFRRLIRVQLDGGSHGLTVCGTTGEPGLLSLAERELLVEVAVDAVAGVVPVIAGTGTADLRSTVRLTHQAQEAGASAVLVVVPYYVKPSQHGLIEYFTRVAAETDLPVVLYDIPGRSGVALDVATIASLAEVHNIVAVKEARADLEHVSRVIAALGEGFAVYCGVETLCYPMLALGGAGHVSATANVAPHEMALMAEAAFADDWDTSRRLHFELLELNDAVFADTNPVPIKTMLGELGLIEPEVRSPLAPLLPETRERVLGALARYQASAASVAPIQKAGSSSV
jgi:4-hydroxy-tetrahydrodipicolinate synthase